MQKNRRLHRLIYSSSTDLTAWSGRFGARLKGSYDLNGLPLPHVRTNLWHAVYTGNTVTLDQVDKISSSLGVRMRW